MIKKIVLALILVFCFGPGFSQFNPKEAKKSLVKVMVKGEGEAGVCTGFIWKHDDWVVTSLHAMIEGADIQVQYLDKYWRPADIVKVYKDADLVLLKSRTAPPAGVVSLASYDQDEIPFSANIHTIGYNNGAKGSSSRLLTKGFVEPETLEALIPEKDREEISDSGFPSLNLEIIYLDGSLLPGYSGSPVFDKDGDLVGIGNGGLESGQSNVSWVIPAKFLRELENSNQTSLPENFEKASQAYSASSKIKLAEETGLKSDTEEWDWEDYEALEELFEDEYDYYAYGNYEFFWTKNRSFLEMYETSLDPGNLAMIAQEFEDYNLTVDYNFMHFDIYEELNSGIVIAIPEDFELQYDDMSGALIAQSIDPDDPGYFSMVFAGATDDFSNTTNQQAIDAIVESLNLNMGLPVGGFSIDYDYSYTIDIDDRYSISWVLMNGNNHMTGADGLSYAINLYATVLLSNDRLFYTLSVATLPVEDFQYMMDYGIDCVNDYDLDAFDCNIVEAYFKTMCAAHMTTFANKQVVRR